MFVSNTDTSMSRSNDVFVATYCTAQLNSLWLPRTASVSSASISVSATPRYAPRRSDDGLPSSTSESVKPPLTGLSSSCGNACRM